ncbi:MAG: tetratricopeptide repeat protein [Acidobacteriales bacterium]|nr:tetratricopeptide repeat protein [Terriglobales bacterium]
MLLRGLFLSTLLGSVFAYAQGIGTGPSATTEIRVRVMFEDDRPVPNMVNVVLMSTQGANVSETFTDDTGHVVFRGVRAGSYYLRARGLEVEETTGPVFGILPRETLHSESLYVRKKEAPTGAGNTPLGQSTVHVSDLNVPREAEKRYQKGLEALRKDAPEKAKVLFEEAISRHPNYASAFNALGVAFMRLGKSEDGKVAFEKAISLDGRFSLPYLNLGMMAMSENRVDDALDQLSKCVANDPLNTDALSRLAYVELLTGKLDRAVANARKVHTVPHEGFEISHLIAARALRKKQLRDEAIAEYRLFLKEAPTSATSPQARQELTELEKQSP